MHVMALCLLSAAVGAADLETVVLEFTAPSRCPPCQQIAPTVSRLQREGFSIRAIDVDMNPGAATPYRIRAVPTFILLLGGREADRIEGKPSETELRRMCERARLAIAASETKADISNLKSQISNPKPDNTGSRPEVCRPDSEIRNLKSEIRDTHSEVGRPDSEIRNLKSEIASPRPSDLSSQPLDFASRLSPLVPQPSVDPIIRAKHDGATALPPVTNADPLHVCPRIRVKDPHGVNFGTGTIIDSREGRTTLLTCGHIFRKLDQKSVIEVDVFNGGTHETFVGKVLRYDLEADVGLLTIPTQHPLPAAPIASLTSVPTTGQHVFSVGCSGGDPPTKLQHRITALNRYLGPDNIECSGVPIQGRSGGGLFDTQGRLIGVCIAADQRDQRGLYAGLKPIHELLSQTEFARRTPKSESLPTAKGLPVRDSESDTALADSSKPPATPLSTKSSPFDSAVDSADSILSDSPFVLARDSGSSPKSVFTTVAEVSPGIAAAAAANSADLRAAVESSGAAEVVCIIRPLNDPRAASRVVIINRASSKFLSQLSGELEQQAQPTSAMVRETRYARAQPESAIRPYRRSASSHPSRSAK